MFESDRTLSFGSGVRDIYSQSNKHHVVAAFPFQTLWHITATLIDNLTTMHLCLQITEILTKIFASYDSDKERIKTLYFLALVCKIFHEPAHNALWRFQRLFFTLVKMFLEDLWDKMEDPGIAVSLLSQY
jgi:hypothetical protein